MILYLSVLDSIACDMPSTLVSFFISWYYLRYVFLEAQETDTDFDFIKMFPQTIQRLLILVLNSIGFVQDDVNIQSTRAHHLFKTYDDASNLEVEKESVALPISSESEAIQERRRTIALKLLNDKLSELQMP